MTRDEIVIAIKDIIATIAPDEDLSALAMDVRLREQIELDSMDFLDIVMELRKRYGVQVPEEDYKELATLQGCVDYLGPKLADKELQHGRPERPGLAAHRCPRHALRRPDHRRRHERARGRHPPGAVRAARRRSSSATRCGAG